MTDPSQPIALTDVLASFEEVFSPRIVVSMNDNDVRVAKFHGEFLWHLHENTDEFFLVLDGEIQIGIRDPDERTVTLPAGSVFLVPQGVVHRPVAARPASVLMVERTGTVTTGDQGGEVPEHLTPSTGRAYA